MQIGSPDYLPIEDYGLIGNMHSAALVGTNGSIDWLCLPSFDSPSVFAKILDCNKGGHFQICPIDQDVTQKQFYWPNSNILVSRFFGEEGVSEIVDFMPVYDDLSEHQNQIIRIVRSVHGRVHLRLTCQPAFNYARHPHQLKIKKENQVYFFSHETSFGLMSQVPVREEHILIDQNGNEFIQFDFCLNEGESVVFCLQEIKRDRSNEQMPSYEQCHELFSSTLTYWRKWLDKCKYSGRWRQMVYRSALVLKLLTYAPTGAIIAAPTCSLPEALGGVRNWDYRYTWLRDAAFTLYAFLRIGYDDEARQFMKWLENRCQDVSFDGELQIMYGIDGRVDLQEEELSHLEGYKGSKPVRIGNGAYNQFQLDIYGELMDSIYLYDKYADPISLNLWNHLTQIINFVCENWTRHDMGIWEYRSEPVHFVYSKLMSWVAIDRAIKIAESRSFPYNRQKWHSIRDQIFEEIIEKGWNDEKGCFTQYYGGEALDASVLMMSIVHFLSPTDPLMTKTVNQINRSPSKGGLVSNGLVYRYNTEETFDGFEDEEGTFNMCSFWLVEVLTRAGKYDENKLEEARFLFERMVGYANHLGLYAEELGVQCESLGNFPQAFTHLAVITAAYNLDKTMEMRK